MILQTAAELAGLARPHNLGMLVSLLEMTVMEAEQYLRLRSKRSLS